MDFHAIPDANPSALGHLKSSGTVFVPWHRWPCSKEVAKNSTVRRKIERLHFFRPPRNRGQEQHFIHSFPGIHARPLPHPYGRESARDHSESTALASPLRQAAAEVRICYSINSIADPDLLTAARKSRPNRKKFGRHLLRPPRLPGRQSPFRQVLKTSQKAGRMRPYSGFF